MPDGDGVPAEAGAVGETNMSKSKTKMSPGRLWIACAVGVLGPALGFIQTLFDGMNRMFLFWTRSDVLLLCGLLAAEATLAFLVVLALRRCFARWLEPLFFFWLVQVVANWFPQGRQSLLPHFPWLTGTLYYLMIWGTGLTVSALAALCPTGRRLAQRGWHALFWGGALLLILPANLWLVSPPHPPASVSPSTLPRHSGNGKAPVVFVVLDMVAYSEVVDAQGCLADDLPNLKAFSERSVFHDRATAPGLETFSSLNGICLQQAVEEPRLENGGITWQTQDGEHLRTGVEGFPRAVTRQVRLAGGRSALCSYYLPWMDWFTGEWAWDAASTRCYYGIGSSRTGWRGLAGRLGLILWQWTEASKTPLAGLLKTFEAWEPGWHRHYAAMSAEIQDEGTAFLRNSLSPGDFVLLHQPLPHPPFAVDAEGRVLPHTQSTASAFRAQLRRADALFGEWMEVLENTGLWDDCWIIVTSDHGLHSPAWSRDPARHDKPHVPLWIKAPGQTGAATDALPVRLDRLRDLPEHIWVFAQEEAP